MMTMAIAHMISMVIMKMLPSAPMTVAPPHATCQSPWTGLGPRSFAADLQEPRQLCMPHCLAPKAVQTIIGT